MPRRHLSIHELKELERCIPPKVREEISKANEEIVKGLFKDLVGDLGTEEHKEFVERIARGKTTKGDEDRILNYCRKQDSHRGIVEKYCDTMVNLFAEIEEWHADENADEDFDTWRLRKQQRRD